MQKQFYWLFLFSLLTLAVSCKNKGNKADENSVVTKWIGKSITVIDTLQSYDPNTNSFNKFSWDKSQKTMIVYIDGTCFTCAEDFVLWGKFMRSVKKTKSNIIFYLHIYDLETMKPYFSKWKFNYPILVDKTNSFYIKNEISPVKLYQAMLLDSDQKIILFGNPVYTKNFTKIYVDELATD